MALIHYWIPLTNYINFEDSFKKVYGTTKTKDISDKVEKEPNNLHVKVEQNKNIIISLNEEEKTYTLKYEDSTEYGLLTYSYDIKDEHILRIIHIQVYHEIKEFFHKHEAHNGDEDALLKAYRNDTRDKEQILKYYLDLYKDKFDDYYDTLLELASPTLLLETYKKTKQTIPEAIKEVSNKQELIININIELNYFYFLIYHIEEENIKKIYKRDFRNFISKFENLYKEYEILDNKFDTLYTSLINKQQNNLAIYGLILAVIGLGLGKWGIDIGKKGLSQSHFDQKYKEIQKKRNECIFKTQSSYNYMISLENKNWELLQNNCSKIK